MHADVFVRAEGRSLLFADQQNCRQDWRDDAVWEQAVNEGVLFPFGLSEKYPLGLRVRVGELDAGEEAAWLGRVRWKLVLPTGKLVVASGLHSLNKPDESRQEAVIVDVPPGDYEAVVYSMVTSLNARFCLMRADGVGWDGQQPFGSWWRESRPGEDLPDWLRAFCMMEPSADPENEAFWNALGGEEIERLEKLRSARPWVDFLLQLRPLLDEPEQPKSDYGVFTETEVRRTAACPDALLRD